MKFKIISNIENFNSKNVTFLQSPEEDRAWLRINMLNKNEAVNVMEEEYHGFLSFSRKKCGRDFLDAFYDGRLTWEIHVNINSWLIEGISQNNIFLTLTLANGLCEDDQTP